MTLVVLIIDREELEARLDEAVRVHRLMPGLEWPSGYRVSWPEFVRSWEDHVGALLSRPAIPNPQAIDRSTETMRWLGFLNVHDQRRLVLVRAGGLSFNLAAAYRWNFIGKGPAKKHTSQYLNRRHGDFLVMILATLRKKRVSKGSEI